MKIRYLLICLFSFLSIFVHAQENPPVEETFNGGIGSGGTAYGLKGGATIATQTWNGYQRNALYSYHADAFIEVLGAWRDKNETGSFKRSSFQAQLGYHRKGSAFRNIIFQGNQPAPNVFHNLSLGLLGKGAFKTGKKHNAYYGIGLHIDYTMTYQLQGFGAQSGVNRFNYGIWLGGGYEWSLSESLALFVEISISPDISKQVYIPPGLPTQFTDPISGQVILSTEQKVYNLPFELSVGIKFIN